LIEGAASTMNHERHEGGTLEAASSGLPGSRIEVGT